MRSGPQPSVANATSVSEYNDPDSKVCIKNLNMEVYRSGHNGPDSKSGIPQGIVGSNPTASANKPLSLIGGRGFAMW